VTTRSIALMPTNGMTMRARGVDDPGWSAAVGPAPIVRLGDALHATDQGVMISGVEDDRRQDGLSSLGSARPHYVERLQL